MKRIFALVLAICMLAIPVLTSCSSSDIVDAINSLDKGDVDSIVSDVQSIVNDHKGSSSSKNEDDVNSDNGGNNDNGNNNGNGNGNDGNSGSGNNGNSGNGNGNNGGGNGNGGSDDEEIPSPVEIIDSELGLIFTKSEDESYYSVSALKSSKKESISIPAEYDGLPVYEISANAFSACVNLKSVSIPKSIVTIGGFAFFRCEDLESIYIQSSVQSIGAYAFDGCSSLSIYCEAPSQPKGWNKKWNPDNRPVEWGYTCQHQWSEATCTEPRICSICAATDGEALGHSYKNGVCTVCGNENGEKVTNISSLADVLCKYNENYYSWEKKFYPEYVVDGKWHTSNEVDLLYGPPTFTFNWDDEYEFTNVVLVIDYDYGLGIDENEIIGRLETVYDHKLLMYNDQGELVYESEKIDGFIYLDEIYVEHDVNCKASRMEIILYYNESSSASLWEVEAYAKGEIFTDHNWQAPTCTEPKHCTDCNLTVGEPFGHYVDPIEWLGEWCNNCDNPIYSCMRCDYAECLCGEYVECMHKWIEPTCTENGYCEVCGEQGEDALGHNIVNGKCTGCGYVEDVEEDEIVVPDGQNVAPLAQVESMDTWWASDPQFLVDGDRTTASLSSSHRKDTSFVFTWDRNYRFTEFIFIMNGKGTAPIAGEIYGAPTSNNYSYDVLLYNEEGKIVYQALLQETSGEKRYSHHKIGIAIGCKLELVIHGNYTPYPIFEVEAYGAEELAECYHEWSDATCFEPQTCIKCGKTEGGVLSHKGGNPTCTTLARCELCDTEYGALAAHDWKGIACTVCGITRSIVTIDDVESFASSRDGEGTKDPQKLFDGDKTSMGIYGDASTEYYPVGSGDTLTITLKKEIDLEKVIIWTCGNWSVTTLKLYDEDGNLTGKQGVIYSTQNAFSKSTSTPVEIVFEKFIKVKTVVIQFDTVKWNDGTTTRTSEIELYKFECSHQWQSATCEAPKTCTLCGQTEGDVGNHSWQSATCTTAAKCTVCGATAGGSLGHDLGKATCTELSTCTRCGYKTGNAYGHIFFDGVCYLCGAKDEIIVSYNSLDGKELKKAVKNSDGSYSLSEYRLSNSNTNSTVTMADGTVVEKEFYGWFDDEGNIYAPGERVNFSKTTYLYEAYGVTVYNAEDFIACLGQYRYNTYVRLGLDITFEKKISSNWTAVTIDLNGYTLKTTTNEVAFDIMRGSFIMLGEGEFIHAPVTENTKNDELGTVRFSRHGYGDQQFPQLFRIGKGVKFTSPYNALTVQSVAYEKMPNIVIAGELNAKSVAYIIPITDRAFCRITEDAKINTSDLIIIKELETDGLRMYLVIEGTTEESDGSIIEKCVIDITVEDGCLKNKGKLKKLTIDEIESIIPSHGGGGAQFVETLFDGDLTTKGVWISSEEYYPEANGDTVTITLSEEKTVRGVSVWGVGNWVYVNLKLYNEQGELVYEETLNYNSAFEAAELVLQIENPLYVKTVILEAETIKANGTTCKTAEIEIFVVE